MNQIIAEFFNRGNYDKEIYKWLKNGDSIDLHKYANLLYFVKHNVNYYDWLRYFTENKHITLFNLENIGIVSKHFIEYFKNKRQTGSMEGSYSISLFGVPIWELSYKNYAWNGQLTIHKIKLIVAVYNNKYRCNNINYVNFMNGHSLTDRNFLTFILACKELGYNKHDKLKISKEDYDLIDDKYIKYLDEKRDIKTYAKHKKFVNASLGCMQYLHTMLCVADDLKTNEIIVSLDSLKQIAETTDCIALLS